VEYDLATGSKRRRGECHRVRTSLRGTQIDSLITLLTGGQPTRTFIDGRYSPNGQRLAVTFLASPADTRHRNSTPKGFELGVIELPDTTMRAIAKYPEGFARPRSAGRRMGREIAFSRYPPLKDDDEREKADPSARLGILVHSAGGGARTIPHDWLESRLAVAAWSRSYPGITSKAVTYTGLGPGLPAERVKLRIGPTHPAR